MFRKNLASQHFHFQGVDTATGGIKSGVTWTVRRCIDGTFAAATGTVTEDGTTGWYKFAMSQADTNGNNIGFNFTGTGAVPQTVNIITTAADPTDAVRLGLTALPNAAAEAAGGLYTRGTGAGQINQPANGMVDANVVRNAGTAITAASGRQEVNVSHFGGSAGTFATGRPEVNTTHAAGTAWGSGAITPGSIASNAITDAKIATDAFTAAKFAASSLNGKGDWNIGKTGYALSAGGVQAIWDALTSALTTASSIGKLLVDNINATISSRSTYAGGDTAGTTTLLSRIVGTLATGTHEPQTGDSFARLGAPAGASVSADVAAVKTQTAAIEVDTQDLQTQVGAAGAGLTAVPWNAAWDAEVQSEVQDAIEVNHLDHLLAVDYDPASKPGTATALLNELVESDAGVSRFTANALEQAPTGGSAPTAAQIADAVWLEAIADHSGTTGSTAEALNAAGAAGDPWTTTLPGAYGAGSAGKIIGDNINATISSRATQTSVDDLPTNAEFTAAVDALPTAAENATSVWAAGTRTLTSFGTLVSDIATAVWAAATRTLSAFGFTVDTNANATETAILADTNELQGDWANGGRLDLILDARASQSSVDDLPTNAELTTALDDIPTANENADALLKRDWTGLTGEASRSVLNALRFIRNKWSVSGTTLTVTKEDDTASAWASTVTTNASADPITGNDPA